MKNFLSLRQLSIALLTVSAVQASNVEERSDTNQKNHPW
jgi:hypothetical protein